MQQLPDTIYVDGTPYHVLGGPLRLARDGVARDAAGRELRGRCVDAARARAWLDAGVATGEEPAAPKAKKAAKRSTTGKKTAAKKKGGA